MKRGILGLVVLVLGLVAQLPLSAAAQTQYAVTQLTNTGSSKYITDSAGNAFIWSDSSGVLSLYDGSAVRSAIAPAAPPAAGYLSRVENSAMDSENVYYSLMEWNTANTLYRFNIYRYNIDTAATTQLTFDTEFQPSIYKGNLIVDGGRLAWVKSMTIGNSYQSTLEIYDLTTSDIQDVSLGSVSSNLVMSGSRIAYARGSGCASATLVLIDLTTNQETPLSANSCAGEIAMSGTLLSWVDRNFQNNTYAVKLYDGSSTILLDSGAFVSRSEMSGNKLVWQNCAALCSVKVYDTSLGTTDEIVNADYASTDGNIVMWREPKQVDNNFIFLPKYKDYSTGTVAYLNTEGYVSNQSQQKYVIGNEFFAWLGSKSSTDRNQIVIARPGVVPDAPTNLSVLASPTKAPVLSWDSSAGAAQYRIYRDGQAITTTSGTAFTDNGATPDGTFTYTVTALSIENSESQPSNQVVVEVDNSPPIVQTPTWTVNPLLQGQNTTLSVGVSDTGTGVASVSYTINGGAPQAMTYDSGSGKWQKTFGDNLPVSTYDIAITATDNLGNSNNTTMDVLVVYTNLDAYVAGHAWIIPTQSDALPIARDTDVNNPTRLVLGFTNVKPATSTTPTTGSFDVHYIVKQNKDEFSLSSTDVTWVAVPDTTHASILGHATLTTYIGGVKTVTANVTVRFDLTLGANGNPDYVVMKIYNPGADPNTTAPTWVVSDQATPQGSKLVIK
jgi:hypothetical protein